MPEIVEVRVVAKVLKNQILGKRIENVKVLYPNIIVGDTREFESSLKGKVFSNVSTFGKWLAFELGELSFLSHLRMEGKYYYVKRETPIEKHTHVVFELDDGMDLRYNDVRKFGRMELVETSKIKENASIKKLGLEPDDEHLTSTYVLEKLKSIKKPIKTALLDQSIINGLGNIYANEVLFASRINPMREAKSISKNEAESIIENSRMIIEKSFEVGGCTIRSYTSSLGVIGHYQEYLLVHGKTGEACPICSTKIVKTKVDGRGTYHCPKCQK